MVETIMAPPPPLTSVSSRNTATPFTCQKEHHLAPQQDADFMLFEVRVRISMRSCTLHLLLKAGRCTSTASAQLQLSQQGLRRT